MRSAAWAKELQEPARMGRDCGWAGSDSDSVVCQCGREGGAGEKGLTRACCSFLTWSLMAATSLVTAEVDSAAAMKAPY